MGKVERKENIDGARGSYFGGTTCYTTGYLDMTEEKIVVSQRKSKTMLS